MITDLSEYYDLNGITVNGKLFKLYDDDVKYTYTIKKKNTRERTNIKKKSSMRTLECMCKRFETVEISIYYAWSRKATYDEISRIVLS